MRIDIYLTEKFKNKFSRNIWKKYISEGKVLVNGKVVSKAYEVFDDDVVTFRNLPEENLTPIPKNHNVEVVFEDDYIVIYNKPRGMPTHPNNQNDDSTLLNHFIFSYPNAIGVGEGGLKSGLVHRLDTFTNGLIVFAKTQKAYENLREQFKAKRFSKSYIAQVYGVAPKFGKIFKSLSHSQKSNKKMIALEKNQENAYTKSLSAKTFFRKISETKLTSTLLVKTFTGRMHQVRVHLYSIGFPLIGDVIYKYQNHSGGDYVEVNTTEGHRLIARSIAFDHPITKKRMRFKL